LSISMGSNIATIGGEAFYRCTKLKSIICKSVQAPTCSSGTFGTSSLYYTGRNTYNTGENMLYVPVGATGYDTSYWLDPLQNATKCGFTISYSL
jgi:hypothetical protein